MGTLAEFAIVFAVPETVVEEEDGMESDIAEDVTADEGAEVGSVVFEADDVESAGTGDVATDEGAEFEPMVEAQLQAMRSDAAPIILTFRSRMMVEVHPAIKWEQLMKARQDFSLEIVHHCV